MLVPLSEIHKVLAPWGLLHAFHDEHYLVKGTVRQLLQEVNVVNWKFNRPPDLERCKEMAQQWYRTRSPLETLLFLVYNGATQRMEMLDGIHRFTALRWLVRENAKPLDVFGSNADHVGHDGDAVGWLLDQPVFLNIRFNVSVGQAIEVFQTLNKTVPVPDLFCRDPGQE